MNNEFEAQTDPPEDAREGEVHGNVTGPRSEPPVDGDDHMEDDIPDVRREGTDEHLQEDPDGGMDLEEPEDNGDQDEVVEIVEPSDDPNDMNFGTDVTTPVFNSTAHPASTSNLRNEQLLQISVDTEEEEEDIVEEREEEETVEEIDDTAGDVSEIIVGSEHTPVDDDATTKNPNDNEATSIPCSERTKKENSVSEAARNLSKGNVYSPEGGQNTSTPSTLQPLVTPEESVNAHPSSAKEDAMTGSLSKKTAAGTSGLADSQGVLPSHFDGSSKVFFDPSQNGEPMPAQIPSVSVSKSDERVQENPIGCPRPESEKFEQSEKTADEIDVGRSGGMSKAHNTFIATPSGEESNDFNSMGPKPVSLADGSASSEVQLHKSVVDRGKSPPVSSVTIEATVPPQTRSVALVSDPADSSAGKKLNESLASTGECEKNVANEVVNPELSLPSEQPASSPKRDNQVGSNSIESSAKSGRVVGGETGSAQNCDLSLSKVVSQSPEKPSDGSVVRTPLFGLGTHTPPQKLVSFSVAASFQSSLNPSAPIFVPKANTLKQNSNQSDPVVARAASSIGRPSEESDAAKLGISKGDKALSKHVSEESSAALTSAMPSEKPISFQLERVIVVKPNTNREKKATLLRREGTYSLEVVNEDGRTIMKIFRTDLEQEAVWLSLTVSRDQLKCAKIKNRLDRLSITRLGAAAPQVDTTTDPAKFFAVFLSEKDCSELLSELSRALESEGIQNADSIADKYTHVKPQQDSKSTAQLEKSLPVSARDNSGKKISAGVNKSSKLLAEKQLLLKKLHLRKLKEKALASAGSSAAGSAMTGSLGAGQAAKSGSDGRQLNQDSANSLNQMLSAAGSATQNLPQTGSGGAKRAASDASLEVPESSKKQKAVNSQEVDGAPKLETCDGRPVELPPIVKTEREKASNAIVAPRELSPSSSPPPTDHASHVASLLDANLKDHSASSRGREKHSEDFRKFMESMTDKYDRLREEATALAKQCAETEDKVIRTNAKRSEMLAEFAKSVQLATKESERLNFKCQNAHEEFNALLKRAIANLEVLRDVSSSGLAKKPGCPEAISQCRPWSVDDFFHRVWTFSPSSWYGFTETGMIDPVECALHGWFNSGHNEIRSTDGAEIVLNEQKLFDPQSSVVEVERIRSLILGSGHVLLSGWIGSSCSNEFRTSEIRSRSKDDLSSCVSSFRSMHIQNFVCSESIRDKFDMAVLAACFNWMPVSETSGGDGICCGWCKKTYQLRCKPVTPKIDIQKSHYNHCPFSNGESYKGNLRALGYSSL